MGKRKARVRNVQYLSHPAQMVFVVKELKNDYEVKTFQDAHRKRKVLTCNRCHAGMPASSTTHRATNKGTFFVLLAFPAPLCCLYSTYVSVTSSGQSSCVQVVYVHASVKDAAVVASNLRPFFAIVHPCKPNDVRIRLLATVFTPGSLEEELRFDARKWFAKIGHIKSPRSEHWRQASDIEAALFFSLHRHCTVAGIIVL
mmetsp:Transcript_73141/g.137983  ORF Transcript_73141/g.137983 Transcript_73141/m.137983 type:complete len:200 (-) Transcript_73141:255-854(-)